MRKKFTEKEMRLVEELRKKFGDSSESSRTAIINAFDGKEKMRLSAETWAKHHNVVAFDTFVAFATAVDLGYRIGISRGDQCWRRRK